MRSSLPVLLGAFLLTVGFLLTVPDQALAHSPLAPTDSVKKEKRGLFKRIFGKKQKADEPGAASAQEAAPQAPVLMEKVKVVERQKNELSSQNNELARKLNDLSSTQGKMNQTLRQQERSIRSMSDAQMRTELIMTTQKKMIDSIAFGKTLDSLNQAQAVLYQKSELQRRETELAETRSQRILLLAGIGLVVMLAGGMYNRFRNVQRYTRQLEAKNSQIKEEQRRSEELLLNILPAVVAEELKQKGYANARHHDQVSVLFTDFVNFTRIAETLTPEQLVTELDECFRGFDTIIAKYGLEKIKIIGDAYLCVGGMPNADPLHAQHTIAAAMDIQAFLAERNERHRELGLPIFEARLGIHTGPVVAGVVGQRKFAYDIWGDTVNVASRLETTSMPGRVNISDATYQLVKENFECTYRGKIDTKNKGQLDMYFVDSEMMIEGIMPPDAKLPPSEHMPSLNSFVE